MNALREFLRIGVNPPNAVGALPASADNLLPLQINNVGRVLMTDGTRAYWGDLPAGGGIAIGDPVTGGSANSVLFVNGSGNLGQDVGLTFDGTDFFLTGNNAGNNGATFIAPAGAMLLTVEGDEGNAVVSVYGSATAATSAQADLNAIADGDASLYLIANAGALQFGIDKSDSAVIVLSRGSSLGTANVFRADGTTFEVVDVLKINNAVAAGAALVSTHKMRINIGGADYDVMLVAV